MDREAKIKISNLGIGIAIAGLLSVLFYFLPFNLLIVAWIDFFGETIGWVIRFSLIFFGLVLYYKYDQADILDSNNDFEE